MDKWSKNFNTFKKALETCKYENLDIKHKKWLHIQRAHFKTSNSKLWKERAKKLNTLNEILGFNWKKSREDLYYKKWFIDFESFKKNLLKEKVYYKLPYERRTWLASQKASYNLYKSKNPIWEERAVKLNSLNEILGFDWKLGNDNDLKWEEKLSEFIALIKEKKGYHNLSRIEKSWLYRQRVAYKNSNSEIWKERAVKLDVLNEILGFDWKNNDN